MDNDRQTKNAASEGTNASPCSVMADSINSTIKYLREIGDSTRGESTFPAAEYADAVADGLEYCLANEISETERLRALMGKMKQEWVQYHNWGQNPLDTLRNIEHLIARGLDPAPNAGAVPRRGSESVTTCK